MKIYSLRSWRPLHRLRGPPPPLWQGRLEIRSVPLRGYGFEMLPERVSEAFLEIVSVPLRGYGFEIRKKGALSWLEIRCFRPLTGIWF